jgi:hypothetical protein
MMMKSAKKNVTIKDVARAVLVCRMFYQCILRLAAPPERPLIGAPKKIVASKYI